MIPRRRSDRVGRSLVKHAPVRPGARFSHRAIDSIPKSETAQHVGSGSDYSSPGQTDSTTPVFLSLGIRPET